MQLVPNSIQVYHQTVVPPNQRLKLTELAVDDFAARCGTIRKIAASHARIFYMELAARRRSLAAIR